jgi:hypothetical protein
MAAQSKDQQSQGSGCGCLLLVVVLVLAVGYRVFIYEGDDKSRPQAAPTSTTLAADEEARMGCFLWWDADDPSILTSDERAARKARALERADRSSVVDVAVAARRAMAAYERDPPFEQFSAALDEFEAACEAVGERSRYP